MLQRYCLISAELGFDAIRQVARTGRYPDNQVYIDMMPVFVSAASRAFKALDNIGVSFKGFDAGVYKAPFTSELEVDLRDIEYIPLKLTNFTRPKFAPSSQNQRLH